MFGLLHRFSNQLIQGLLVGLVVPIAALNLWLIAQAINYAQPLFSILISAALLAFLLNYPVHSLQKRGLDRGYAIAGVIVLAISLLISASITIFPQSIEELGEFVSVLPMWIQSTTQRLQIIQNWAIEHRIPIHVNQWTNQFTEQLPSRLQALGETTLNLLFTALGGVTNLALTGIFTVYLLVDGERLWNGIFQRFPHPKITALQRSLQQHFQNYFTGQAIITTVTITALILVFLVLAVPFPLLLGLLIGTASIVPFGGLIASLISAVLFATDEPSLGLWILGSAIVTNQTMDQIVTPRIMGNLTGLRPIWVLLALLTGAKIGGLIGLLIAVPIASCVKDAIEGFPDSVDSNEG